ncbi:MAG: hypothetical protein HY868_07430 [Chloroflexi bacterium]|nr:hypothetical protein [Chloroflexota bacterium]
MQSAMVHRDPSLYTSSRVNTFERFAAISAMLVGVVGVLYSVAFIVLKDATLYSLFLMLGGLFSTLALVALYYRVRDADGALASWAVALGLVAAFGSLIHGGYDLANALNPPATNVPALADLPSQIDPRGLLTFGIAGIAMFGFASLITRGARISKGLGYLGYISAILLIVIYLGRLIVLNATSPVIVIPALLEGFIVNPIWYIWLGLTLFKSEG